MPANDELHIFWKHVFITGGLCLLLFPILPLMYLAGLAVYYTINAILYRRRRILDWLWRKLPWKAFRALLLATAMAVAVVFALSGLEVFRYRNTAERDGLILVFQLMFLPPVVAYMYLLPVLRRRRQAKREQREYEARDRMRAIEVNAKRDTDEKLAVQRSLTELEDKRRELLRLYIQCKPFLNGTDWSDESFVNFDRFKVSLYEGRRSGVIAELQRIRASLERDAMIGRLKMEYAEMRPVVGQDISERAFATLIATIPQWGRPNIETACDDIRSMLMQSFERHAPQWHALKSEEHLDNLLTVLDAPNVEEIEWEDPDVIQIQKEDPPSAPGKATFR